eukprot:snap_masked-scaffold_4-processed-gene-9.27-mRNA-1 protein AED:1.00 eAED:1.00 QI:0/0/0/0/1/1/2/0/284
MAFLKRLAEEEGCSIFLGEVCGAHGTCVNGTCMCENGWFSSRDLYSSKASSPCISNLVLLQTLYMISTILHLIGLYVTIQRLAQLETAFFGFDPVVSILLALGVILSFHAFSRYYARFLAYLKQLSFIRENKRSIMEIKYGIYAFSTIPKLGIIFCIPFVSVSLLDLTKNAEQKFLITFVWGSFILYSLLILLHLIFIRQVVKDAESLLVSYSTSHGETPETRRMEKALLRLRNARALYTLVFIVIAGQFLVAILSVEYVLFQYASPAALCFSGFTYLIQSRAS